jgi:hypothetical protein
MPTTGGLDMADSAACLSRDDVSMRKAIGTFTEKLKALLIFAAVMMSPLAYRLRRGKGDPGNARLRSLTTSPLICLPLPEGYEVLSVESTPTHWEMQGYALFGGHPAWTGILVLEHFRSTEPIARVQELWADRATADGWAPDDRPMPPDQRAWKKQFDGYEAAFGLSAMTSDGLYQVALDAPPRGRRRHPRH